MEIDNKDYSDIVTNIADMKADIRNLKEDKEILKSLLTEIKGLQIQNATLIEQVGALKSSQEVFTKNLKCIDDNVKQDINSVKSEVYTLKMQPLDTYNKGKERAIMGIISGVVGAIVGAIMAYLISRIK